MFRLLLASGRSRCQPTVLGALFAAMALFPAYAQAGPGYELDSVKPSIALDGEVPHGIAIDQASQNIYVAELSADLASKAPGQVAQLLASGVPTINSPFTSTGEDFFIGVAVNPTTQGVYAYQTEANTPFGHLGFSQMNTFSSTGVPGPSFNPSNSSAPQIAADSTGRVFYPNDISHVVQVFSSTGVLEETISCTGCPGGSFAEPASVALDAIDNLYVVDTANGSRAIKLKPVGGDYVYDSVVQSGEEAVAIGVDPANGDVLVGDLSGGSYHIVAYDSSGTQFDDFAAELLQTPQFPNVFGQIAVNATTHKVYLTDPNANKLWVFARIASIPAPTAATNPASSVGQVEATLQATVDAKGHALSDCHFEYTDEADFQVNGYANASLVPCPFNPAGTGGTPVSAHISGLSPATTYEYRILVASNGGAAEDGDETFTTLSLAIPSVASVAASSITQVKATLAGSVNPHGGLISDCHFDYTSSADFQANGFTNAASAECVPIPEGTSAESVSVKITGLTAGTEYRFRVVATNNAGTAESTDKAFATLADTCATKPALCPLPPPAKEPGTPPISVPAQLPAQPPATSPAKKPLKCRKGFKKKRVRGKAKCVRLKRHHRR